MEFEIVDFQHLDGKGTAQYQFTIDFGDIAVFGGRVYNWGSDKLPFVALPSRKDPATGRHAPYVRVTDPEVWRAIGAVVREYVERKREPRAPGGRAPERACHQWRAVGACVP